MHRSYWVSRLVGTTALFAVFVGCGSDDGAGSVTESPDLGASTEMLVTASAGGDVVLDDTGVKLAVPAGALAADTMIRAEVISKMELKDASQLAGNVVEFGPHGLQFEVPATLELALGTAVIPAGAKVSLAWYNENAKAWEDLPGSARVGDKLVATTTHFSMFAIRFVVAANGDVVQEAGQCSNAFNACGGEIAGTWRITSGCADVGDLFGNVGGQCQGASFSLGMDVTGDIVIGAGRISGTMSMTSEVTQVMPKSCIGGSCPTADDVDGDAVVVDKGATCEMTQHETESNVLDEQYRVEGSKFIVIDAASGEEDDNTSFCVTGNSLVVNTATDDGVTIRWMATRK
jgi:ZU5 domain